MSKNDCGEDATMKRQSEEGENGQKCVGALLDGEGKITPPFILWEMLMDACQSLVDTHAKTKKKN